MNRRIPVVAGAAAGGLLTTAFLSAAVAAADSEGGAAELGENAFTAGDFTFDPTGEADTDYSIDFPPLLQIGTADQDFDVYSAGGDDAAPEQLGTLSADTDVSNILGIETTQFTFDSDNFEAADGDDGGGGADGGGGDVDADAIADALREAGISDSDFGEDQNVDSLADALANDDLTFDGNITGDDVVDALQGTEVADDFDIELDEGDSPEFSDDIGFTKGDVAEALNTLSGEGDSGDGADGGGADGAAGDLPADGTSYTVTDF